MSPLEPRPVVGDNGRMTLTPARALLGIVALAGIVLGAQQLIGASQGRSSYTRVGPDAKGMVTIPIGDLAPLEARFYRFLNSGNQEVLFFIAKDEKGVPQVAFDAGESHFKLRRGFRVQDGWVVDGKCGSTTHLADVNSGGSGCRPAPLDHQLVGDTVVLRESDVLAGWRFFH